MVVSKLRIVGGGFILHMNEHLSFSIQVGLGRGANNYVELHSLKHLLLFAREQNCQKIQIFGDSQLVINWINDVYHCHLHTLRDTLDDVFTLKSQFYFIVCSHIYRERSEIVDHLSKEATQLNKGQWIVYEYRDGEFYKFFHRPFIDMNGNHSKLSL